MRRIASLVVLLTLCITLAPSAEDTLNARDIMESVREATQLTGSEAVSTLTIIDNKGRERVRKIAQVSRLFDDGDTEKRLIRFLSPADVKGTGLLTFDYEEKDDDLWLYMPALRKTRRIVTSEKAKNFMGSEFAYADMSPATLDDFTYKMLDEQEIDDTTCWQIEMTPVDEDVADENGFSKRIVCIGQSDFVLRKATYYDLDGELHKVLTVSEIKELDPENHKYRPMLMMMENHQNGRKSIFKIDQIEFSPGVKEEYFTTRYLERE